NRIAREFLIRWGVPKNDVIGEENSRDTFENALETQKILARHGWKRYLLVTSAMHMPRSMLVFSQLVPEPIPAPGDFSLGSRGRRIIRDHSRICRLVKLLLASSLFRSVSISAHLLLRPSAFAKRLGSDRNSRWTGRHSRRKTLPRVPAMISIRNLLKLYK